MPDRGQRAGPGRVADHHGGHPEFLQDGHPLVTDLQVDQEHPVHPALRPPGPVQRDLRVLVLGQGEQQRGVVTGQLGLDARDELGEPGLDAERAGGPVDDQPERARPAIGQRAGRAVRLEADLLGDGQDAVPGGGGHAGLPVQCEGHRSLGHSGAARDVRDGRTLHHASQQPPCSTVRPCDGARVPPVPQALRWPV
jgi:hypothetical protein